MSEQPATPVGPAGRETPRSPQHIATEIRVRWDAERGSPRALQLKLELAIAAAIQAERDRQAQGEQALINRIQELEQSEDRLEAQVRELESALYVPESIAEEAARLADSLRTEIRYAPGDEGGGYYFDFDAEGLLAEALHAVQRQAAGAAEQDGWQPVTADQPPLGQVVLGFRPDLGILLDWRTVHGWRGHGLHAEPTHWRPLPAEPPRQHKETSHE